MNVQVMVQRLRKMAGDTSRIECDGCGFEHNCGTNGCAVMQEAAEKLVELNTFEKTNSYRLMRKLSEEREKRRWIPVAERIPDSDRYVLLSFQNFTGLLVGRCETDEEGSAFFVGDETVSCSKMGVFVNAWMELPERYVGGRG